MWELQPDPDAAGALGETLRGLGYDEDAIEDRLEEDGAAAEACDAVVHARRIANDELDDAIRLPLLARPVARSSPPGTRTRSSRPISTRAHSRSRRSAQR